MKTNLIFQLGMILVAAASLSDCLYGDQLQDRAAVIESINSYVAAFNRRDADAVAKHWSSDGELIEPNGNILTGRKAIRESFAKLFDELSNEQFLSVTVNRISFVTEDVAMEEGVAYVVGGWESSYVATHKLEDGMWRVHTVRENAIPPRTSKYGQLKELEWMIGNWVDESVDSTVESSCNWSKNRNFINRNFRVSVPGMEPLEGTQIIGFNSSTGKIVSWIFDSDGGIGQGVWSRKGNSWEVRSSQVLSDGRKASSKNIYTMKGNDQFSWRSTDRKVDGEVMPNTESVDVFRVREETAK